VDEVLIQKRLINFYEKVLASMAEQKDDLFDCAKCVLADDAETALMIGKELRKANNHEQENQFGKPEEDRGEPGSDM
jgi:hypothetical protein